jgi:hypothetical protein
MEAEDRIPSARQIGWTPNEHGYEGRKTKRGDQDPCEHFALRGRAREGPRSRSGDRVCLNAWLALGSNPDVGPVMTLGNLDQNVVTSSVGFVVPGQLRPEFRGLDSDRRVDARVERLGLIEDTYADDVLL